MQHFTRNLVAITTLSSLCASIAFANEHPVKINITCPAISSSGDSKVTNYGTYLAGKGSARVNSDASSYPLFQGPIVPGANIPTDLLAAGYDNKSVNYDPISGAVTCYYKSSKGFAPFSISYLMSNALNGVTISATSAQVHIKIPTCLK